MAFHILFIPCAFSYTLSSTPFRGYVPQQIRLVKAVHTNYIHVSIDVLFKDYRKEKYETPFAEYEDEHQVDEDRWRKITLCKCRLGDLCEARNVIM